MDYVKMKRSQFALVALSSGFVVPSPIKNFTCKPQDLVGLIFGFTFTYTDGGYNTSVQFFILYNEHKGGSPLKAYVQYSEYFQFYECKAPNGNPLSSDLVAHGQLRSKENPGFCITVPNAATNLSISDDRIKQERCGYKNSTRIWQQIFTLPTRENLSKGCETYELSMSGDPNKKKTNNPVYLTALIVDDDKNVKFMKPSNFSGNYYTPLITTGSANNLPDRCIIGGIVRN